MLILWKLSEITGWQPSTFATRGHLQTVNISGNTVVPGWFDGVLSAVFRAHLVYRGATTHPPDPPRRGPNEATALEFSIYAFLDACSSCGKLCPKNADQRQPGCHRPGGAGLCEGVQQSRCQGAGRPVVV